MGHKLNEVEEEAALNTAAIAQCRGGGSAVAGQVASGFGISCFLIFSN